MTGADPLLVGVFADTTATRRTRLLAALELAFPVHFEARRRGELGGLDAVLDRGNGVAAREAAAAGTPALFMLGDEPAEAGVAAAPFDLARSPLLDPRLRGASLPDRRLLSGLRHEGAGDRPGPAASVLGRWGEHPVWWAEGPLRVALLAPRELGESEALRDRLCAGRALALLPLVEFLRGLSAKIAWTPPPPAAAYIIDDPNLHWPTYGYIELPVLARHAREHGYHAVLATVPLDARWAHAGALEAIAASAGAISLAVHGNDHDGGELGRVDTTMAATAVAAQALRRVARFECRTGHPIERVMVPPHEACSAATLAALLRCGYEAISMTIPFPWLGVAHGDWLARPPHADALVGWRSIERATGLPTILRHQLVGRSPAEMRLRAYLDQPVVLYGHHDDLAPGLDLLAETQDEIAAIAPATAWRSLASISRRAYETRAEGATLAVRALANQLRVEVPAGTDALRFEPPLGPPSSPRLVVDGQAAEYGQTIALAPGADVVTVDSGPAPIEPAEVPSPPRRPLAVARRIAGESRDRLAPLLAR
ncbi:MAG: hypothetical protein ACRDPE_15120 [Solirubrobacterales bacterium]